MPESIPQTGSRPPHTHHKWRGRLGWMLGGLVIITVALTARHYWETGQASAQDRASGVRPASASRATPPANISGPVAEVNGEKIDRNELANACLLRFGEEVLESLTNKHLVAQHCQANNITVTQQEVEQEIDRMARRFSLGREAWLDMLQRERGINPSQYARDIVWPSLALRKLAANRLTVTEEELRKAYEAQFGASVRVRLITVDKEETARMIHAKLQSQPDEFPKLAQQHSTDVNSASIGGLIQPVRRHVGDPKIEQVVFGLSDGEISPIVRVGNQYAIFRCEAHVPARPVPLAQVRSTLEEQIRDEKLRSEAHEIFGQLQAGAVVKNIINDPVARQQMPGVAATVNDRKIMTRELAEECIVRHGETVLETVINHRLLVQALRESRMEVTQADLDAEIAHAAKLSGVVDAQGAADIERWIEMVTTQEDVTKELYIRDAVWPSAALKKLTVDGVQVTQEDIQKGFNANYGPRVRCRAIVSDTQRHAQEAWDHARQALRQASDVAQKAEIFGQVAAEYSVEPSSKALEGKVPPIRKHGGQPALEREAFALKPGDMSGVIQVADKFVVLYCEGLTEPVTVDLQEVQQLIYDDVYEKKVRMAMSTRFEKLKADATIENHLAAVNQLPAAQAAAGRTAAAAATAARPGNGPRR